MKIKNSYITFNGRNHSQVLDFIFETHDEVDEYGLETYATLTAENGFGLKVGDTIMWDDNGKLHGIKMAIKKDLIVYF